MQFTKHIHVLHLLSTIPAPAPTGEHGFIRSPVSSEDAIACWDHLFSYIHDHWAKPMSASIIGRETSVHMAEYVDCQTMLRMGHDELVAKLESLPPYFREEIFPVAVARYLLRDMCLPINHRLSTTFAVFHTRYGNMILA